MIKDCFHCVYQDYKISEEPCDSCLSLSAKESYSKFVPIEQDIDKIRKEADHYENTNQDTV